MLLLFAFLPKQEFTTNCQNCKFKEQQLPIYSITSLPFPTDEEVGTVIVSGEAAPSGYSVASDQGSCFRLQN